MGIAELPQDIAATTQLARVRETLIERFKEYIPEYNEIKTSAHSDKSISVEMLGYKLVAKPRVVKMWGAAGDIYLQWEFFTEKGGAAIPVGGFYLDATGIVYDYGTGSFNSAPSKRLGDVLNQQYLVKNILGDLHTTFCNSDVLTP